MPEGLGEGVEGWGAGLRAGWQPFWQLRGPEAQCVIREEFDIRVSRKLSTHGVLCHTVWWGYTCDTETPAKPSKVVCGVAVRHMRDPCSQHHPLGIPCW